MLPSISRLGLPAKASCFALGMLAIIVLDAAANWGKLRLSGYNLLHGDLVYDCRPAVDRVGLVHDGRASLRKLDDHPDKKNQ